MECPNCRIGKIFHYREDNLSHKIPLNKDNTPKKNSRKWETITDRAVIDYLQCDECSDMFDYEIDQKGRFSISGDYKSYP